MKLTMNCKFLQSLVLFQAIIYSFSFRKRKKDFNVLNNMLVQDFCPLKTEIAQICLKRYLHLCNKHQHALA